jgi:hypothetical protein
VLSGLIDLPFQFHSLSGLSARQLELSSSTRLSSPLIRQLEFPFATGRLYTPARLIIRSSQCCPALPTFPFIIRIQFFQLYRSV